MKNVRVEISRQWIELAVVSRGRIRAVHRILVDPNDGPDARGEGHAFPPNLRQYIAHGLSMTGVSGAWVHVIWHADGCCADMHEVVAPASAACGAALLAFFAANGLDQAVWATSAHRLAEATPAGGKNDQHVLVSALRNDSLSEIEQIVRECGCTLRSVIPAQSVALLLAARGAIDTSARNAAPNVCIHFGEEAASIAIARSGLLLMARTVEMGFSTLREAYIRAAHMDGKSHAEAFLEGHKRLVETHGIPSPKDGADAVAVFQSVRPFIQRLFIEIKQTIRFTLDEEEIESARVHLMGPGAEIPRLAQMLGEEAGFPSVVPVASSHARSDPGRGISEALDIRATNLAVQPPGRVEKRERSHRRAALVYGAAAAVVLLAGDAYLALHRAERDATRVRALQAELNERRTTAEAGHGLSPEALARALETLAESDSGLRADWGAVLSEIVVARPDGIWFTGVAGERKRDESSLSADAIIEVGPHESDPHELVAQFVETLESSDLIRDVRLGGTEQVDRAGMRQLRFSLTLGVHEAAAPWLIAEVAP